MTECSAEQLDIQGLGRRVVVGRFDGGPISSDGGVLLLREVEARTGILAGLAPCFSDDRDPDRIEHTKLELLVQRVMGIAQGWEDLNDHDRLRHDPLFAAAVGKSDPSGADRVGGADCGNAFGRPDELVRSQ